MRLTGNIEYDIAMQLPAWHRIQVRSEGISRTLTPHELCLLREVFDVAMMAADDDLRGEFYSLAVTLGLVKDHMDHA